MFVDYTQAVATNDQSRQTKAFSDLDGYRQNFDVFLAQANPNLPRGAVAELLKPHFLTFTSVVDAQAAKDSVRVYTTLKAAAGHMHMVGDPLSEAIVRQFPEKFR